MPVLAAAALEALDAEREEIEGRLVERCRELKAAEDNQAPWEARSKWLELLSIEVWAIGSHLTAHDELAEAVKRLLIRRLGL